MSSISKSVKYWVLYSLIFPMGMFPGNYIRQLVLPWFTRRCGRRFWVYPNVHIFAIEGLVCGDYVNIAYNVYLNCSGGVSIGSYTGIGPHSSIQSTIHNYPKGQLWRNSGDTIRPVTIGSDCLIGAGCHILPGTELGDSCVVLPGSVVSGKYEGNMIIGGNPARVVKRRE
jgi:acetyltransferase-like isoleucine patch superfamily enzyme